MHQLADLDGRHLAGSGAVSSLEARLKRLFGMRHALAMSSATTAMLSLALALEIRGRDVIVPAFAHGATVAGWLLTGNRLRFTDVEKSTLTLDPRAIAAQVTSRTAAIVAVDWFGIPADSERLRRVADAHGLPYISDAAQAMTARRGGEPPGWCADAVVVSFTTGKDLDAGEGGAILTNRSDLYERLVWHTQHPHRQHRDVSLGASNVFGLNGRIHPLAAVLADRGLTASLVRGRRRSARIRGMLASLVESKTIEPTRLAGADIEPSFFRVPMTPRAGISNWHLEDLSAECGPRLRHDPIPLMPLYGDASLAPYRAQVVPPATCATAERLTSSISVFGA